MKKRPATRSSPTPVRRRKKRKTVSIPGFTREAAVALGGEIRSARKRLKLNQTKFGKLIGTGQRAISQWELGRALSGVRVGLRLAEVLAQHRSEQDPMLQELRAMNHSIANLGGKRR
jgi:DNA-binding transcriptional regulator YiaG